MWFYSPTTLDLSGLEGGILGVELKNLNEHIKMSILTTEKSGLEIALMLDSKHTTGERALAHYAAQRVLEGKEPRLKLDEDAQVTLAGASSLLKRAVNSLEPQYVFVDKDGLLEKSIELLATLPEAEARKQRIDHRRRMAGQLAINIRHTFVDVTPTIVEEPEKTLNEMTDWGDQYEWLYTRVPAEVAPPSRSEVGDLQPSPDAMSRNTQ